MTEYDILKNMKFAKEGASGSGKKVKVTAKKVASAEKKSGSAPAKKSSKAKSSSSKPSSAKASSAKASSAKASSAKASAPAKKTGSSGAAGSKKTGSKPAQAKAADTKKASSAAKKSSSASADTSAKTAAKKTNNGSGKAASSAKKPSGGKHNPVKGQKPAAAAAAATGTAVRAGSSKPKHQKAKHAASSAFGCGTVFLILFALFLAAVIAGMVWVGKIVYDTPKIDADNIYSLLSQSSKVYDRKGKEVQMLYSGENRTNVKYEDLPDNLVNAFVALEDKTFWTHHGFNVIRIFGAIKEKLTSGGSVGGTSTITQQLARNVFLKDRMTEHTMKRKIQEAWYAIQIEHSLSKEEIMEAYLNTIYLGFNSNGVAAASKAYFSRSVKKLNLSQCATLAALVKSPSELAPIQIYENGSVPHKEVKVLSTSPIGTFVLNNAVKERRDLCLSLMLEQGYIDQEHYNKAVKRSVKKTVKPNYSAVATKQSYFTDYAVQKVIDDLQEKKGMTYEEAYDKVYRGGLKIYTTYDQKIQKIIEDAFENNASYPRPTNLIYNSDGDMLNKKGRLIMYKYSNFITEKKNLVLPPDEAKIRKDGSLVIYANKRMKIYKTEVNGGIDFSIEIPTLYVWDDYQLYSISGGYLNIPQQYKTRTKKGNIIVAAEYMKMDDTKKMIGKAQNGGVKFSKNIYTLNQRTIQPQSAMTIIENKTGYVLAMVGGRKIKRGRMLYNRAIEPRQPGSSIKPLAVYSAALQQSAEEAQAGRKHTYVDYHIDKQGVKGWGDYITASSYIGDEPLRVNGKIWPKNAGGGYSGKNTLRTALRKSINTCAVKILHQVGIEYSAKMVKKYGITTLDTEGAVSDINYAALALGGMTNGVSTLEMANAYTTFPNNGTKTKEPIVYKKVVDSNGEVLLSADDIGRKRVLDPGVAWIMVDIMKGVVTAGTGSAARIYGVDVAGKTGTTSDEYDLWFDGYTPKYTASLWMGNDYNIKLSGMSGWAAGLWGKIMAQVPGITEGSYKAMPSDVVRGGNEFYAKGTEKGRSTYYAELEKKEKEAKEKKKREEERKRKLAEEKRKKEAEAKKKAAEEKAAKKKAKEQAKKKEKKKDKGDEEKKDD